jgi:hypothetical protein
LSIAWVASLAFKSWSIFQPTPEKTTANAAPVFWDVVSRIESVEGS